MRICSFDGCGRKHSGRGLCSTHNQQRLAGKPLTEIANRTRKQCDFTPCGSLAIARGLCGAHYDQRRRGETLCPKRVVGSLEERIESRLVKSESCWTWTGAHSDVGYAQVSVNGKAQYVHRVMYERECGPLIPGMEIDHICHNRGCVNPDHLEQVTHKQNGENRKGPAANNTSGYRGVTREARTGRWAARAGELGRYHSFGFFDTAEEAAEAASAGRALLFTNSRMDIDDIDDDGPGIIRGSD